VTYRLPSSAGNGGPVLDPDLLIMVRMADLIDRGGVAALSAGPSGHRTVSPPGFGLKARQWPYRRKASGQYVDLSGLIRGQSHILPQRFRSRL
jgi:hypothetical protein